MTKSRIILIVGVILVIIGISISFYQSQMELNDIATQEQGLKPDSLMTVSKNLDPAKSEDGVYSVQISDFKVGNNIRANVLDPTGSIITTNSIMKNQFQENFTISQLGNYTLQIQNMGQNETQVLAIIGYYPQGATVLDVLGFIVLIVGLGGLGVGLLYLIKRRGKTNVS